MLFGFFNRIAPVNVLKEGLDIGSQRTRLIADRVAKATMQNADAFTLPGAKAAPGSTESGAVDLEAEMTSLADEQLRYEATAKLLEKTYAQIRTGITDK